MADEINQERPLSPTKATSNLRLIPAGQASGRRGVPGTDNANVRCALRSPCRLRHNNVRKRRKLPISRSDPPSRLASTTTTEFSGMTTDSDRYYVNDYLPRYANRLKKRGSTQNGTRDRKIRIKLQIILPEVSATKREVSRRTGFGKKLKTRRDLRDHSRNSMTGYGKESRSFKLFVGSALLLGILVGAGLSLWSLSLKNERERLRLLAAERAQSPLLLHRPPSAPRELPAMIEYQEPAAPAWPMLERPSPDWTSATSSELCFPEAAQLSERGNSPSSTASPPTLSLPPLPPREQAPSRQMLRTLSDGASWPPAGQSADDWLSPSVGADDMLIVSQQQQVQETPGEHQEVFEKALWAQDITREHSPLAQNTENVIVQAGTKAPLSSVRSQASLCPGSSPCGSEYYTPPSHVSSPSAELPEDSTPEMECLAQWLRRATAATSGGTAVEGGATGGSTQFT